MPLSSLMLSVRDIRYKPTSPINVRRVKAARQLVLREGPNLDSKKLTELRRGQILVVMEEIRNEEGEVRARVGKDTSPRGASATTQSNSRFHDNPL